tara:strand:+ start:4651 stop:5583 length:933 start_codon:yes stop_codon:yes gene_type:complete
MSAHVTSDSTDSILRGRDNATILNSSIAVASLDMGVPSAPMSLWEVPYMVTNNTWLMGLGPLYTSRHPLFSAESNEFTLFGLDFSDLYRQLFEGAAPAHYTRMYGEAVDPACATSMGFCTPGVDGAMRDGESVAATIGLPDLPYGELAHLAHLGLAAYDTVRTAQEVASDEQVGWNPVKILTHPDMMHTLCARGVMLTVMGLSHPFGGALVGIGLAYLAAHLVHSAFGWLESHKDLVKQMENTTILSSIYNHTGLKAWVEQGASEKVGLPEVDPFVEKDYTPHVPDTKVYHGVLKDLLRSKTGHVGRDAA